MSQSAVSTKNTWDNPLTKKRSQCNSRLWGYWPMNNQSHWSVTERQHAHHSKHEQLSKTTRPHAQEAAGKKKGPRYHHLLQGPPTLTRLYPLEVLPPPQQFHFVFNQVWLLITTATQGTHPWVYSGGVCRGRKLRWEDLAWMGVEWRNSPGWDSGMNKEKMRLSTSICCSLPWLYTPSLPPTTQGPPSLLYILHHKKLNPLVSHKPIVSSSLLP